MKNASNFLGKKKKKKKDSVKDMYFVKNFVLEMILLNYSLYKNFLFFHLFGFSINTAAL